MQQDAKTIEDLTMTRDLVGTLETEIKSSKHKLEKKQSIQAFDYATPKLALPGGGVARTRSNSLPANFKENHSQDPSESLSFRAYRTDTPSFNAHSGIGREGAAHVSIPLSRGLEDIQQDIQSALSNTENEYLSNATDRFDTKIINAGSENGYVCLSEKASNKKLLDASADPDRVTVYRHLSANKQIPAEERARIILKSMGIPPLKDEDGYDKFSMPDVLVVNGKKQPPSNNLTGSNQEANKVIEQMFIQFEAYKNARKTLNATPDTDRSQP
jgi:hypothetical protein